MKQKINMVKNKNLTVEEAIELFLRKAKVRNLSDNTVVTYRCHLGIFCKYMNKEQLVGKIDEKCVDGFIAYLKEHTSANEITINSYLRTIRVFLYYCMDCNYIEQFKIEMPKVGKKAKQTYTDEELRRLLKKPDLKKCSFAEYRIWAFENYLLATGNRISSALNVRIGDIDFESGSIFIRKTKNRKQQIIPLSKTLADILKEYLEIRGGNENDFVFCNIYGEQGNRRTFQQEVKAYNIKRNVNKTSCHLFRHTFAKKWILAGGDVFRLQKLLGHCDLEMTKEYVQLFQEDLQQDFEQYNPLDQMSKNRKLIEMRGKRS